MRRGRHKYTYVVNGFKLQTLWQLVSSPDLFAECVQNILQGFVFKMRILHNNSATFPTTRISLEKIFIFVCQQHLVLNTWDKNSFCLLLSQPKSKVRVQSQKSKVKRTWSDSILLCHHHHISTCAAPYLRLRPPTKTFLSNQTSNWAQIFTVNSPDQD